MTRLTFSSDVLLKTLITCAVLSTASHFARATNPSPTDEIITHLAGQHARLFVLNDGRIVLQTGSVDPNQPNSFVVDETVGFTLQNATSSLSIVVKGNNKTFDVDGQYLASLNGSTNDVSVIKLAATAGEGTQNVVEMQGDVQIEVVGNEAVRLVVSTTGASPLTFTFSVSTSGLQFEDLSASGGSTSTSHCDGAQCCYVRCGTDSNGNAIEGCVGPNCILCSCSCSLFDPNVPVCICWLFNIFAHGVVVS